MPIQARPSLTTTLESRYSNQNEGGAFNVKNTLGPAGSSPKTGTVLGNITMQEAKFQSPAGFEVKVLQGRTQFLDAQGGTSKQLSIYLKGFSNQKYAP